MRWSRCLRPIVLAALALAAAPAEGQDRVEVAGAGGGRTIVTGRVVDFTGEGLVLETQGGRQQTIAADAVRRVETTYGDLHRAADEAFARADFNQALNLYRGALKQDPRQWVRRQILAQIVGCYRSLGHARTAVETFFLLASSNPPPADFASIPLAWMPPTPSADLDQAAKSWLARPEPVAKLLGASYLLLGVDGRAARDALEEVVRDGDPVLAALAQAQQWRTVVATVDEAELEGWERAVERLPESLRGGPYYVLGQAWLHRGRWDRGAWTLLRVPIAYPRERELAARSLLDAGRALEKLDRATDAAPLYREVMGSYAATPAALEAQRRLEAQK